MSRPRVVYVIHADPKDRTPIEILERFPTAPSTVAAVRAHGGFEVSAVARTNGPTKNLEFNGVGWQFVADRSRVGLRVALAVRRQRPNVIHMNGLIFPLPTLLLRVLCGRQVRIVVQHHGEPPGVGRTRRAQRLARRVVDGYLFTGATGQAAPWRDARIFAPDTPLFEVLESSTDVERLPQPVAQRESTMSGSPAIVWVGHLKHDKDPLTAVRAMAALPNEAAHLWMIFQSASLMADVEAEVAAVPGLGERVHLIGEIPHDEIGRWLSAADIFLSTSHHEGSGYALIEALACGCTPVVTNIAPHRAIAGPLGAHFRVGDPVDCALALGRSALFDRAAVIDHFDRRLSWAAVARQLVMAYGFD